MVALLSAEVCPLSDCPSSIIVLFHIVYMVTNEEYKLLCPRGTQTCALAVANIAHAVREMLDVAKRPIPQG